MADDRVLKTAFRWGQKLADPMLLMVLCRTLRRAIGDIVPVISSALIIDKKPVNKYYIGHKKLFEKLISQQNWLIKH